MKKKRRSQSVPKAHVSATYKKMTIDVPEVPISEPMPAIVTFYVDTRFTTAQSNRIRNMIANVLGFWRDHYQQLDEQGSSRYQSCVSKYARFNLSPVWFEDKIANGAAAAGVQMDALTTMIAANGFGRAAKAYIMYKKSKGDTIVKSVNASDPEKNSLTVTINPEQLSKTTLAETTPMGALYYAWIRRQGYLHPAVKYTSYFAGEASMCVMRGNNNKVPGQSDKVYSRYLN